jgi:hypothetical protein
LISNKAFLSAAGNHARRYHLLAKLPGFQAGQASWRTDPQSTFIILKNLQNQRICHVLI